MIKYIAVALSLTLAGCGSIFIVPGIKEQVGDAQVTVVPLTRQVVAQANRSSYRPRALPAVFTQNAGGGSAVRGAGALPDPVSVAQIRSFPVCLPRKTAGKDIPSRMTGRLRYRTWVACKWPGSIWKRPKPPSFRHLSRTS